MSFLRPTDDAPATVAALAAWLEASDPEELLIQTSGSTGAPKRVVLTRDAVVASARASLDRLAVPEGARWVLDLPASYVAGVQVAVRSLLAGRSPLFDLPDEGGEPLVVSLVPTQLHRLVEHDPATLRRFHTVLLGGGHFGADLRAAAEAEGVRVVPTYGASETAGGCVYDGLPLDGVEMRTGADARVALRGPMLFSRYEGDPGLTAETLVDGWFLTSDAGTITDGRLRLLGRVDEVVVSGGLNVPTPAVAARLRELPGVKAVEVVGVPDAEWGQRVVACVLGTLDLAEARDWVAEVHPRAWAPREVVVLDAFPELPNGKVDRRTLQTVLGKR